VARVEDGEKEPRERLDGEGWEAPRVVESGSQREAPFEVPEGARFDVAFGGGRVRTFQLHGAAAWGVGIAVLVLVAVFVALAFAVAASAAVIGAVVVAVMGALGLARLGGGRTKRELRGGGAEERVPEERHLGAREERLDRKREKP
jgi:hypothetical protein